MKKDISTIDKNFRIDNSFKEKNIVFYNVKEEPFAIYGLCNPNQGDIFRRLPERVAKSVSEGVDMLSRNTAGGRIRFKTNSKYVALKVILDEVNLMPHMPLAGSSGFDMYERKRGQYHYKGTFLTSWGCDAVQKIEHDKGYENILYFDEEGIKDLTINFPLYNGIRDVYIGLEDGCVLESGDEYANMKPVVFYGSSVTQGGCASRPGNSYPAILSRRYNFDYINLGFSGSAKGEIEIAEYIAKLPMSIFVYDYDYNAPSVESLKRTHERMFQIIREHNPDLPIIVASKPVFFLNDENMQRKDVIYKTYLNAINSGDKNVYFVAGNEMFNGLFEDAGTVDGVHPNDLGFYCMAESFSRIFDSLILPDANN